MKLSTKIFLGFSLILLLYVIGFVVNSRLFNQVNRNTEFLTRSETIIRNSSRLHKSIINMQSGFRGFLLTDNENFLDSYNEGMKEIPRLVGEQEGMLAESSFQRSKLDSIKALHAKWVKYADAIIRAKRDSVAETIGEQAYRLLFENQLKKEVGKQMNDNIARHFRAFDTHEYTVRKQWRDQLNASVERSRMTSLLLTIASVTIGLICAWYLTRLISRRISTMVAFAGQISKGNFQSIEDDQHDELSNLSVSLNTMSSKLNKNITELERKNKELDQFAYVVSHDLKAPLRGIDNVCGWIEEDMSQELSTEMKNYLGIMKGRVHRLEDLIDGLLAYARIGRTKRVIQEVNVKSLLEDVTDLIVPPEFHVVISGDMPVMQAEKLRMEQVFVNLLSNAVKHHDKKAGTIRITAAESGDFYRFTVTDDGPGIEPEYHEKIFAIFQTLRDRDSKESTGVGLAIVKKIIDDQKGTITVRSEPGKGTTFEFTWPAQPAFILEQEGAELTTN